MSRGIRENAPQSTQSYVDWMFYEFIHFTSWIDLSLVNIFLLPTFTDSFKNIFIHSWVKQKGSPPVHSYVPEWLNNGLSIVGGCCKTTADDIRIFRKYVNEFNTRNNKWCNTLYFIISEVINDDTSLLQRWTRFLIISCLVLWVSNFLYEIFDVWSSYIIRIFF